jgi:hypothetical protein
MSQTTLNIHMIYTPKNDNEHGYTNMGIPNCENCETTQGFCSTCDLGLLISGSPAVHGLQF